MSFFKVSTAEDQIKDSAGSSNFINKSGIYDVLVKAVIVDTTPNGSMSLNLWIEYNEQPQMLYGAIRMTNNDGTPNFQAVLLNKLAVCSGLKDGTEIEEPIPVDLPVGKGGENKECMVLQEIQDAPVAIRIQMEYSMYEGKVMEKKIVKNFYRVPDHKTAMEIVNNGESKQYDKDMEIADKNNLKDGLTEDDVTEYKKNRKNGNANPTKEEKKPLSFGQKRSFK